MLRREESQLLRSLDRRFESRPLMPPAGVSQIEMYELTLAARSRHLPDGYGQATGPAMAHACAAVPLQV